MSSVAVYNQSYLERHQERRVAMLTDGAGYLNRFTQRFAQSSVTEKIFSTGCLVKR